MKQQQPKRRLRAEQLETRNLLAVSIDLIADLNDESDSNHSTSFFSTGIVGDHLLFVTSTPQLGTEPWSINTATLETKNLGDLTPGAGHSHLNIYASGEAALIVKNGTPYAQVWRLDGETGELTLLADDMQLFLLAKSPSQLLFSHNNTEIVSIEFASGAIVRTAIDHEAVSSEFMRGHNERSIHWNDDFIIQSVVDDTTQLQIVDASTFAATTIAEAEWLEPVGSNEDYVFYGEGRLHQFVTSSLWRTDGTQEGILQLATFPESYISPPFADSHGFLHFATGDRLISTDGTIDGTRQYDWNVGEIAESNGQLFVSVINDGDRELWLIDNPQAEPELLISFVREELRIPHIGPLTVAENLVFFGAVDGFGKAGLWASNGTVAGTGLYADTSFGAGSLGDVKYANGRLFALVESEQFGREPHALTLDRWNNRIANFDVNGDTQISPIDALLVINELNKPVYSSPIDGSIGEQEPPYFFDVTDDGTISPIDALRVINQLSDASATSTARSIAFAEYGEDEEEEQRASTLDLQVFPS